MAFRMMPVAVNRICRIAYERPPAKKPLLRTSSHIPAKATFDELIRVAPVIVDKSLLIWDIVDANAGASGKLFNFNYPSGFGKSVALGLLRRFFEMEIDGNGQPVQPEDTAAYKLFVDGETSDGRTLEPRLAISTFINAGGEAVKEHLAQHPVINLDFACDGCGTAEGAARELKTAVRDEFERHSESLLDWLYDCKDNHVKEWKRAECARTIKTYEGFLEVVPNEDAVAGLLVSGGQKLNSNGRK